MSFDKLGKSIKEDYQLSSHDYDNEDLLRIISKISKLSDKNRYIFCRWIKYGFIEGSQATASPMGTIVFNDWSSEYDSLIHDLVDNGLARMTERGFVEVPYMMRWPEIVDISPICELDGITYIGDGEIVYPSPMVMKVPQAKEIIEETYDDLNRLFVSAVKRLGYYINGKVIHVGINVHSLGFVNTILFRSPIDVLVITDDRTVIAHKIIDPSKTVHRGLSSLEHYLMDGVDYAMLIHKYTHYEEHVDTFNKILNRQYIKDAGFAIVPYELDYIMLLKWPRYNSIIMKSQSIAVRRSLINNAISFMINTR